jgi:hypothetical protein
MKSPLSNLDQIRRCALSLAEVTEQPHFDYVSFRFAAKSSSPFRLMGCICMCSSPRNNANSRWPCTQACVEKLRWGGKVVGLRVDLAKAEGKAVKELIRQAWARKAPKSLARS